MTNITTICPYKSYLPCTSTFLPKHEYFLDGNPFIFDVCGHE